MPRCSNNRPKQSTKQDYCKKRKPMKRLDYKAAAKKDKKGNTIKKTTRWQPGTVALREIKALQKGTQLLIHEAPFHRLVREVMDKHKQDLRFNTSALKAVQQAAEKYMITYFQSALIMQLHRKGSTLIQQDLCCTTFLRGDEQTR